MQPQGGGMGGGDGGGLSDYVHHLATVSAYRCSATVLKMGLSAAYNTRGTFGSQKMGHGDAVDTDGRVLNRRQGACSPSVPPI